MNKIIRILIAFLACTIACIINVHVSAQGMLHLHEPGKLIRPVPPPNPGPPRPIPLPGPRPRPKPVRPAELTNLGLKIHIEAQVSTTTIDQTFVNPNNMRLEGTYLFPLPVNAVVNKLSLYIDDKPVKAEVIEAKKARKIYEDIVRKMRDPALLEYVGRDLVKLRVFPIEPHQVRRVRFAYSQVLDRNFGMTEYSFPLAARNQTAHRIGQVSVAGSIDADSPVTTVYSPTHDFEFNRKSGTRIKFGFEQENHRPSSNLKILYGVSKKDLGASLVSYKKKGDAGHFMLIVAPRYETKRKDAAIPKDVTFVFDTSGSMQGEKIVQAKQALEFCLQSLRKEDKFNIIRFSTETERFADRRVPASSANVKRAVEFVDEFVATGGTAIHDALTEAVGDRRAKHRPHLIVFLTDGKPTVGETGEDAIVDHVTEKNDAGSRIFVFGVGDSVNTHLLDKISGDNGGASDYVTPDEDIELKVSNFFSKVADPVLTDVDLDFGGMRVAKVYPSKMPDLFRGSQITIIGRYKGSGSTTVTLTGKVAGKRRTREYTVKFAKKSTTADFLPRLWAIRRVGHLVDEIRKHGEDKELVDEVVRLGKKYAIATPYTSMLVLEDTTRATVAQGRRRHGNHHFYSRDGREEDALRLESPAGGMGSSQDHVATLPHSASSLLRQKSGAASVQIAKVTRDMKEENVSREPESERVSCVADRTFYFVDGVWTDSEYDGEAETHDIEYGSDEYFDLPGKDDVIGEYLALGPEVLFQFDGTWYRIVDKE